MSAEAHAYNAKVRARLEAIVELRQATASLDEGIGKRVDEEELRQLALRWHAARRVAKELGIELDY